MSCWQSYKLLEKGQEERQKATQVWDLEFYLSNMAKLKNEPSCLCSVRNQILQMYDTIQEVKDIWPRYALQRIQTYTFLDIYIQNIQFPFIISLFKLAHLCSRSVLSDSLTPWTIAFQAPLSMEYSRQEYLSRLPFPTLGDLPDPGIKTSSLVPPALAGEFFQQMDTFTTVPPLFKA